MFEYSNDSRELFESGDIYLFISIRYGPKYKKLVFSLKLFFRCINNGEKQIKNILGYNRNVFVHPFSQMLFEGWHCRAALYVWRDGVVEFGGPVKETPSSQ